MVQMAKVAELIEAWQAKGNPPCDHPRVDKEYHLGSATGDDACLVCGASWPRGRRPEPEPAD
jgi:hypothetical protein